MSEFVSNQYVEEHDYTGAKMGMWLFLFTELLLFGGLFLLYSVFRIQYTSEFHVAASTLNVPIGVINTLVLLTSSLTMVISITALRCNNKRLSLYMLGTTIALGIVFLVNKYFEWAAKIHHDIYPGSESLALKDHGEIMFYNLYYTMTGLHGLHVIIGIILLAVLWVWIRQDKISKTSFIKLENAGLYWHLVDLIWIFLLPLFYLTN